MIEPDPPSDGPTPRRQPPWQPRIPLLCRSKAAVVRLPELRDLPEPIAVDLYDLCYVLAMARQPYWVRRMPRLLLPGGLAGGVLTIALLGIQAGLLAVALGCAALLHWRERRAHRDLLLLLAEARRTGRFPCCRHCGYDLRGSPGPTCPECGTSIWIGRVPGLEPRPQGNGPDEP